MTATAAESTQMAHTPDVRPDPPAAKGAAAGTRLRAVLGDNPLQTALATVAVALLVFVLTDNRSRVDRVEDTVNARIDRLEDTMNTSFAEQDAKIDEINLKLTALIDELDMRLTAKIDEINLKLTALIAALNKTGEVDAAIEGRLLDSEPPAGDPGGVPRRRGPVLP